MNTVWKGISANGVLHLVESYANQEKHWMSLCGRKGGSKKHTESLEKIDTGRTCCSICCTMQKRKIQSKSLLEASFQVS